MAVALLRFRQQQLLVVDSQQQEQQHQWVLRRRRRQLEMGSVLTILRRWLQMYHMQLLCCRQRLRPRLQLQCLVIHCCS